MLMEENNVTFNRIYVGEGGSFEFVNGTGMSDKNVSTPDNTLTGGTGQYVVFKIRFQGNADENLALVLYDGANAGFVQDSHRLWSASGTIVVGEWVTYVVDIGLWSGSWYTANNTSAAKASFALNCGGKVDGRYVDVAYFAVCDDWSEVKTVVGNDKVNYTKWTDTSFNKTLNSDGSEIK
jgi:hypothetical protein